MVGKLALMREFLCGVSVAVLSCGTAMAQADAPAAGADYVVDGEIVVTALRRAQRAQDVPAALAVLSADDIRAKGVQDLRDYLTTVPGINYGENNVGGMRVAIRGVSDGVGGTDPLAGIYIDEAPVTESSAGTLDPNIYDIERVEVLKGPQGTLYGSGSMGGTVRIITKKPVLDTFEGSVEGDLSSYVGGSESYRLDGVVNVPLLQDKLALRVSAGYRKDGGWIDDLPRAKKGANTIEKTNVRAQLLFKPGEDTSINLGVLYQDENTGLPPFDDLLSVEKYTSGKIYRQARESEAVLASLTINQAWDGVSLTSATNYLDKKGDATFDLTPGQARLVRIFTGVTLPSTEGIGLAAPVHNKQFTQEVRLSSTNPQRVEWLIGGYYSDVTSTIVEQFDFSQAPSLDGVLTSDEYYFSSRKSDTRQLAGFGELTFNVNDQLAVVGGIRVFDVRQSDVSRAGGLLNDGDSFENRESHFSSSTKKVLVRYQPNRDHMIYAQAVQGYRNGGPNSAIPTSACGPALEEAGYTSAPTNYGPDKLWNYELGSKNTLLGGRAQLNAAVFFIDWSRIQNTVALSCGLSFIANTGKAESKGFEIEGTVEPLDGLTLTGSVSYVDAEVTHVAPGVAGAVGDPLPLTGQWSWNANINYEREVSDRLTAFARAEVSQVDDRWNTFRSITARAVQMDGYTTVSARVGVRGENWSVALYGANLTNERYVLYVNPGNYENVGRPRSVGVNARLGF